MNFNLEYDPDFDRNNQNTENQSSFFGTIKPKTAFIFGLIAAVALTSMLALVILLIVYFKV